MYTPSRKSSCGESAKSRPSRLKQFLADEPLARGRLELATSAGVNGWALERFRLVLGVSLLGMGRRDEAQPLFKACTLGVQYGMGAESLAASIGDTLDVARELLRLHRQTYPKYWRWSESAVDHAMLYRHLHTVFVWRRLNVGPDVNPRSLANFPCQANGAEMLRLARCLMAERGVGLCAPIHDAILVEGSADSIDETVNKAQAAMREASAIVLVINFGSVSNWGCHTHG